MTVCAWALNDSEADLHTAQRNREHVLGQQFRPLVEGVGAYEHQRIHLDAEDADLNSHRTWSSYNPVDWVTRAFCKSCNGGWMAALDNAARPIVDQLLGGASLKLAAADQQALAAWAYKVSLALDFVADVTPRHHPAVRSAFFHSRQVPGHVAVSAGNVDFTYANALYGLRTGTLPLPGLAPFRIASLLLRNVLIQVTSSCDGTVTVPPLDLMPLRDGARTVVHPTRGGSVDWPPTRAVDTQPALVQVIQGVAPFPPEGP